MADGQDDNPILGVWHPEPNHKGNSPPGLQAEDKSEGIISHHEVLARLEAYDTDRGEPFTPNIQSAEKCFHLG